MDPERLAWLAEAARLLGAQADSATALEALLAQVFHYDARQTLARVENQAVMAREAARLVLRELASLVLDSSAIDSDRYKEIITALKERTGRRGQELFHPVRLALAGRSGEGENDRVILLVDGAAGLAWSVPVKSCRQRMVEFCAAID
jgi:Anticodon binding domain